MAGMNPRVDALDESREVGFVLIVCIRSFGD